MIAHRSVSYETNPPPGSWTHSYLLAAWKNGDDFIEVKEEVRVLLDNYPTVVDTVYSRSSVHNDLKQCLNAGASIFNCVAHGIPEEMLIWSRIHHPYPDTSWTVEDADSMQNGGKRPVVYAYCCWTGAIHYDEPCLGEAFMNAPNGGAIGYLGASHGAPRGPIPGVYDTSLFRATFPANPSDPRIYTVGKIHNYGDAAVLDFDSPFSPLTVKVFVWLGDPELSIWTDEPESLTVEHPHYILPPFPETFACTVGCEGTPVEGACVCLYRPEEIYEIIYTDYSGQVEIDFPGPGILYVTVTKHNFLPYQGTCFITEHPGEFIRGDYDGDGQLLTNDPLMELNWIFKVPGAVPPSCKDAADYDDDGRILSNDPLMALQFIFGVPGSTPPPPPYPDCELDPTEDPLDCVWHDYCMGGGRGLAYEPPVCVEGAPNRLVVGEAVASEDGVAIVPVDLVNSKALCGFEYTITYDPKLIAAKAVRDSGLITEKFDFFAPNIDVEVGKIKVGNVPDLEMKNMLAAGKYRVANIGFRLVVDELKAAIPLELENVALYDSLVNALPTEWIDGLIKPTGGLAKPVASSLPEEFGLSQNYPNPFNPITEIRYALPSDCWVKLEVFNIAGQRVVTLVDESQQAGYKNTFWDGRDENGRQTSSGIYFYRLQAQYFSNTKKLVIIR